MARQALELFKAIEANAKHIEKVQEEYDVGESSSEYDKLRRAITGSVISVFFTSEETTGIKVNKFSLSDIGSEFIDSLINRFKAKYADEEFLRKLPEYLVKALYVKLEEIDYRYGQDKNLHEKFILCSYLAHIFINYLEDAKLGKIFFLDLKTYFEKISKTENNKLVKQRIQAYLNSLEKQLGLLKPSGSEPDERKSKIKKFSKESDSGNRRFDSIAWLIQGNDVVSASFFDGDDLLLATNKPYESDLTKKVKLYLGEVADWSSKVVPTSDKTSDSLIASCEKACEKRKLDLLEYAFKNIDFFINDKDSDKEYREAFFRSLFKVTVSIITSYLPGHASSKAFPKKLSDAIKNKKIKVITEPNLSNKDLHAEMRILQYLFSSGSEWYKTFFEKGKRYMGASKKCCSNCANVIKAVNEFIKKDKTKIVDEFLFVHTRAEHGLLFPAAYPPFLRTFPEIQKIFLKLSNCKTLEEAFNRSSEINKIKSIRQVHDASETLGDTMDSPTESSDKESNFDEPKESKESISELQEQLDDAVEILSDDGDNSSEESEENIESALVFRKEMDNFLNILDRVAIKRKKAQECYLSVKDKEKSTNVTDLVNAYEKINRAINYLESAKLQFALTYFPQKIYEEISKNLQLLNNLLKSCKLAIERCTTGARTPTIPTTRAPMGRPFAQARTTPGVGFGYAQQQPTPQRIPTQTPPQRGAVDQERIKRYQGGRTRSGIK